jgi:hypothetical protein
MANHIDLTFGVFAGTPSSETNNRRLLLAGDNDVWGARKGTNQDN